MICNQNPPDLAKEPIPIRIPIKIPRTAKTMLPFRSGTQQQHLDSILVKRGVLNYKYNVFIIIAEICICNLEFSCFILIKNLQVENTVEHADLYLTLEDLEDQNRYHLISWDSKS